MAAQQRADIGDYLKAAACTAVMGQSVLGLGMARHPTATQQWGMGLVFDLIKFTAPAFIFGILYTTSRLHQQVPQSNGAYWRQQWHVLGVPTVWWTLIYLTCQPSVQQHTLYHTVAGFAWQAVNGNAAPHLWYNAMMLQFIVLMPLFWALADWVGTNYRRGWWALGLTGIAYLGWLALFPWSPTYLIDRVFLSFLPYGVAGILAWRLSRWRPWLYRYRWGLLALIVAAYGWLTWQLVGRGLPVDLARASYYQVSTTVYAFAVILGIALVGYRQLKRPGRLVATIHWFATYAYRAFLSHVFWLTLLWPLTARLPLVGRLVVSYLGTWVLAFSMAYVIHVIWQGLKRGVRHQ